MFTKFTINIKNNNWAHRRHIHKINFYIHVYTIYFRKFGPLIVMGPGPSPGLPTVRTGPVVGVFQLEDMILEKSYTIHRISELSDAIFYRNIFFRLQRFKQRVSQQVDHKRFLFGFLPTI